jgi:TolB-like protein
MIYFFTDGIHDDLLTQLAKIKDLKVISRTSVMEYRGATKKFPGIAQEQNVTASFFYELNSRGDTINRYQ